MEEKWVGRAVKVVAEKLHIAKSKFLLKVPLEYPAAGAEWKTKCCHLYLTQDGRLFSFEAIGGQPLDAAWLFDGPDDALEWLEQRLKWLKTTIQSSHPDPVQET